MAGSHKGHGHLYRGGAKGAQKRNFEKRYGKKKGAYVYGAVVGKVKREREMAKHSPFCLCRTTGDLTHCTCGKGR